MLLLALALLQQVPTARLETPTAAPREPFTEITGVVELPDGRLLVADAEERRVVLLDPGSSTVTALSRKGAGPQEFRSISHLFPRPGGGAWLADFAQRRLLPIRGDGTVEDAVAVPPSLLLAAVDAAGRIYADLFGKFVNGITSDSMTVVRWAPGSQRVDTLMKRNANWSLRTGRGTAARRMLPPLDASVVLANGDVVTLEAATYRVDRWHDGKRISTATVPWTPVRMTEEEKAALVQSEEPPKSLNGGNGPPPAWKERERIWPASMPPFVEDDVHASSDGRIWVRLYRPHGDSTAQYDLLDDHGKLIGKVSLRPGSRVAGFGKGVVYVSEKNDDDELRVRRYSLPRF